MLASSAGTASYAKVIANSKRVRMSCAQAQRVNEALAPLLSAAPAEPSRIVEHA